MKTFRKLLLELAEMTKSDVTGHIPHTGELIYTGESHVAMEHIEATQGTLTGNQNPDHRLSIKADGSMSVIFGKRNGIPFAQYAKGKGDVEFRTIEDIEKFANAENKPYYIGPMTASLRAAGHPSIGDNHAYQADVILQSQDTGGLRGNLISYKKPSSDTTSILAVHSQFDSGKKIRSNPDVSFLNTKEQHFPHLALTDLPPMSEETATLLSGHIDKAKSIFADPDVQKMSREIADRPETNKTATLSKFLVKFSNNIQRGDRDLNGVVLDRTHAGLTKFAEKEMQRASMSAKDKSRIQSHLAFFTGREHVLEKLFTAHTSLDAARDVMIGHITSGNLSLTTDTGQQHEGFVSELRGKMVKLVPSTFSTSNSQQREKFKKTPTPLEEETSNSNVVFFPGKFGTITSAHEAMTIEAIEHARSIGATHFIHGPSTSKTHILSWDEKKSILGNIVRPHMGEMEWGITQPEAINPFFGIEELVKRGHRNITVIGGSDRMGEGDPRNLRKSLETSMAKNGGMWKTKEGALIPIQLRFHQVGENRNSQEGLSMVSGTRLREHINSGNLSAATEMMPPSMTSEEKSKYADLLSKRSLKVESIVSNMFRYIFEDGEGGGEGGMTTSSGIAGIGPDAREPGGVIVRKRPRLFKRRKQR